MTSAAGERPATLASIWLRAGDLRIHALASPPATRGRPPVVLVHGVAVSSRNMRPTAEALAPHCQVLSPDLPGHGRSDSPRAVLGVSALADALVETVAAAEIDRPVLLGNSFGCQIIVDAAARHPGCLRGAVLQGPTADPEARSWLRQIGRWMVNGRREGATQPGVALHDWRDAGLRRLILTARHSLRDRIEDKLAQVTVPTLVVRGERDPIVPQRWAERVVDLLPDGRLQVLPDATHTITYTRPHQLVHVVVPFLDERFSSGEVRRR